MEFELKSEPEAASESVSSLKPADTTLETSHNSIVEADNTLVASSITFQESEVELFKGKIDTMAAEVIFNTQENLNNIKNKEKDKNKNSAKSEPVAMPALKYSIEAITETNANGQTALEVATTAILDKLVVRRRRSSDESKVLQALGDTFTGYRYSNAKSEYLPLQPVLNENLQRRLQNNDITPVARHEIYNLLEQLPTESYSPDQVSGILKVMDHNKSHGDLKHPFASALYVHLKESDPDNAFCNNQEERIANLEAKLAVKPQEAFGNFEELKSLSQGIIHFKQPNGVALMRLEFVSNRFWNLPPKLTHFTFSTNIGHNNSYLVMDEVDGQNSLSKQKELTALHHWLRDQRTDGTIHFVTQSPLSPAIKQAIPNLVVEGHTQGQQQGSKIVSKFKFDGTTSPSVFMEIQSLISAEAPVSIASSDNKITLNQVPTKDQVNWGHLCTYLPSPEARFAALVNLSQLTWKQIYEPEQLIHSYAKEALVYLSQTFRAEYNSGSNYSFIYKNLAERLHKYGILTAHELANSYIDLGNRQKLAVLMALIPQTKDVDDSVIVQLITLSDDVIAPALIDFIKSNRYQVSMDTTIQVLENKRLNTSVKDFLVKRLLRVRNINGELLLQMLSSESSNVREAATHLARKALTKDIALMVTMAQSKDKTLQRAGQEAISKYALKSQEKIDAAGKPKNNNIEDLVKLMVEKRLDQVIEIINMVDLPKLSLLEMHTSQVQGIQDALLDALIRKQSELEFQDLITLTNQTNYNDEDKIIKFICERITDTEEGIRLITDPNSSYKEMITVKLITKGKLSLEDLTSVKLLSVLKTQIKPLLNHVRAELSTRTDITVEIILELIERDITTRNASHDQTGFHSYTSLKNEYDQETYKLFKAILVSKEVKFEQLVKLYNGNNLEAMTIAGQIFNEMEISSGIIIQTIINQPPKAYARDSFIDVIKDRIRTKASFSKESCFLLLKSNNDRLQRLFWEAFPFIQDLNQEELITLFNDPKTEYHRAEVLKRLNPSKLTVDQLCLINVKGNEEFATIIYGDFARNGQLTLDLYNKLMQVADEDGTTVLLGYVDQIVDLNFDQLFELLKSQIYTPLSSHEAACNSLYERFIEQNSSLDLVMDLLKVSDCPYGVRSMVVEYLAQNIRDDKMANDIINFLIEDEDEVSIHKFITYYFEMLLNQDKPMTFT